MKTIKMLVSMAGPEEHYAPGDTLSVSDNVAEAWKNAGIATIEDEQEKPKRGKVANADGN